MPNEIIYLPDDTLIRNFEVDFKEEEELTYAGGIKGIRALRVQRDLINETIMKEPVQHEFGNKFSAYERIAKEERKEWHD